MKITYKEFSKMFSFCLNDKILSFFATEDIRNKVINSKILLKYVNEEINTDLEWGEELFFFVLKKTNNVFKTSLKSMSSSRLSKVLYDNIFEFLEEEGFFDDVVLEITADKIKRFMKKERLEKEFVISHIIDYSLENVKDKLINYLKLDLYDDDVYRGDKIIDEIFKFKMDRFCEAVYQIIAMNMNED